MSQLAQSGYFREKSDDFNYPMPNRRDLMSNMRNSIADVNINCYHKQPEQLNRQQKFRSTSLQTADISGAQSQMKSYKFTNKVSYINKCDDIIDKKKAEIIRQSTFLSHNQLKGSQPQKVKLITRRSVNPICPDYKLPSYENLEPIQPKFIKDPLNIQDIEGSKAVKDKWHGYTRNVNPYTEIEGSHPKIQKVYKDKFDSLKVDDIVQRKWVSKKNTNPLEPRYVYRSEYDKSVVNDTYGEIKGTTTKPSVNLEKKPRLFNTSTQDIEGAQADYIQNKALLLKTRKEFRQTTNTKDIEGTQPGTLNLKKMQTKRCTNPLRPEYDNPGHTEFNDDMYGPAFQFGEQINQMKLHTQLIENKINNMGQSQSQIKNSINIKNLPKMETKLQSVNNIQNPNKVQTRQVQSQQRQRRSQTSNLGSSTNSRQQSYQPKPTVAQQLDGFIQK